MIFNCAICKKQFSAFPSDRRVVCSKQCGSEYKSKIQSGRTHSVEWTERIQAARKITINARPKKQIKLCSRCKCHKPIVEFRHNGRDHHCKECINLDLREYRARNPVQRLRAIWVAMLYRCESQISSAWEYYGGRGIKVCQEWHNFEVFHTWLLANGWKSGLEIDRINNNGNYEPQNCRLVTPMVNVRNRRSCYLTMEKADELRDWAARGHSTSTLAKAFQIPRNVVYGVVIGRTWRKTA